jgi:protein-S-isoprenylcysteine O-methyltransferase Ste14
MAINLSLEVYIHKSEEGPKKAGVIFFHLNKHNYRLINNTYSIFASRNLLTMEISGKPPIHPFLFASGKFAGYFTWLMLLDSMAGLTLLFQPEGGRLAYAAYLALITGTALILVSSFTLGRSLRIGLPTEDTVLHSGGIYRFTRNPMYLGLHMVTLAAMLITQKWWVALPGIFSIYVYHLIILGEEKFLEGRFGEEYIIYRQKTRRYL